MRYRWLWVVILLTITLGHTSVMSSDVGSWGDQGDRRYDTLIHIQDEGYSGFPEGQDRTWEIALESGVYNIFLVCRDPDATDQINTLDIEGTIVPDLEEDNHSDEYTLTNLEVTDGRLTIAPAEGAFNAKLCFIEIYVADTSFNPPPVVDAGPDQAIRSDETIPAFPGAEGFGKWSQGGRGGDVYVVTNLNDSGPGSLREAVEASGPRTTVFEVSGTIFLNGKLRITNPYITIAGQTAPGDGICIAECSLIIEAEHSIIRYMRCRLGDNVDSGDGDTISIRNDNVIIDHCSASWSVDEVLSTYMDPSDSSWPDKVTVQWTIVAEALRNSDIKSEPHSMGLLLRGSYGSRYSFHHNLYLHNATRNPRPGNDTPGDEDSEGLILDWRNNVVYNWKGKSAGANYDDTEYSKYNFINNYYLEGPNSRGDDAFTDDCRNAKQYFAGNYMNGVMPGNPWSLVGGRETGGRQSSPFPVESVTTETAPEAYASVLDYVGASLVRDAVDTRLINDVINRTGRIIDHEEEVGGWPTLNSTTPPADTDRDGMPDAWEKKRGLNPNDASDGAKDRDKDGYTNVEEYINGLVATKK